MSNETKPSRSRSRRGKRNVRGRPRVLGAGGVVLNAAGEVLLIRYADGAWTFPKGHIDPGETIAIAAVREVHEEGGVRAEIVSDLGFTEYVNPRGEARRVHWFTMKTAATETVPEEGFQAGFFALGPAMKRLAHTQNRMLLERAARVLGVPVPPRAPKLETASTAPKPPPKAGGRR